MGNSDQLLHDVGAHLSQITTAPPPVVYDAAKCAFRAMLGCPVSTAAASDLGADPDLRALLGAAFRLLQNHPEFWNQFYLQSARTAPLSDSHPWAPAIAQAADGAAAPVDPSSAAAPSTSVANGATPPVGVAMLTQAGLFRPLWSTGARKGAHSLRSARHGGRGRHPGVHDRFARGGPFGDGAFYIIDEQQSLDDVDSPVDTEPEAVAHAGYWMGM
jgi:hypothetical protein